MTRSFRRVTVSLAVATILVLAAAGFVTAAPPDGATKGPPTMGKVVSIHYPRGFEARGGAPGAPDKPDKPAGNEKVWYKYSGIHWAVPDVDYVVNLTGSGDDGTFMGGVDAAFRQWDDVSAISFTNIGTLTGVPSSFVGDGTMNDANEVGWVSISSAYPSAIAVTVTWYNRLTLEIHEVDLAFNADLPWAQAVLAEGVDPDTVRGDLTAYDVQNIATHEAGHWLMLGDLYNRPTTALTMYGYGSKGELQKRSLESGDIAGALAIYPEA